MELRHLQTFEAVVREGSFLRAAEHLQYAQSTITLHIQQLEADLGVQLFARRGKRVQLTEAGRALYGQATHLLQRAEALQQTMADLATGEGGHLRVGAIEPTASHRLPPLLVDFCQQHPRVRLTLEVGGARAISQRVAAGDLDLGISSPPVARLGLSFEPLFIERMLLLVPAEHRLATAPRIAPEDVAAERLLLSERTCAYRDVVERELIRQGATPVSGIEIGSLEALKRAVQAGLGVAIIPEIIVSPPPAGTVLREIDGVEIGLSVGLITRPDDGIPPRALRTLADAARRHLRSEAHGQAQ